MQNKLTAHSIAIMLTNPNKDYVMHVVGKACVAIFNNQTESEQASNTTHIDNKIGFTGADSICGSLTAKSYLKNKRLQQWQVDKWTRVNKHGIPRLAKYHKQLNIAAQQKATAKNS